MARKRNYLNNRDLLEEIVKSKELDELTPKALEFLMLLADKSSKKLSYANPDDNFLEDLSEIIICKPR